MEQTIVCLNSLTDRLLSEFGIDIYEVPIRDGFMGNFWHLMHELCKEQLKQDLQGEVKTLVIDLKKIMMMKKTLSPDFKKHCDENVELLDYYGSTVKQVEAENELDWKLRVVMKIIELEPHLVED
ncbi:hypothetical protein LMH73_014670, partial [Vibrio splendidus]